MATDPIDRISVEIETTASGAEKGVGDLVRVLESLNNVLDRIAGTGAAKSIREVGRAASKAGSETSVAKKQRALSRATETITGRTGNESHDEEYRRVNEARRARTKEVYRKRDAGEYKGVPYSKTPKTAYGEAYNVIKKFMADTTGNAKFDYEKYSKAAEGIFDTDGLKEKISEATAIIDNYKAKIRELKEELSGLDDTGIKKLVAGDFQTAANQIDDLSQKISSLEIMAQNASISNRLIDDGKIEPTVSLIDDLVASIERAKGNAESASSAASEALKNAEQSVVNARARVDELSNSLFANRTIWDAIKSSAANALDNVKTKLAEAAAQSEKWASALKFGIPIIGTLGSILGSVLRGGLTLLGKLWSGFKRLASTIAGAVVGGLQKLGSMLKTVGGSVLNYVTKPFQRAISVIQKWKKTLGRLVFLRVVRSAIKAVTDGFKEGIENLYYFSSLVGTQFAPAMDSLASSSQYLKNSLGAMAAPLIQAVAPAVNHLIDLFVSLLNVINMVFSVLGGRTYTKALKTSAKYADDLDKSLGGGASSAKELQRYLIGIDQLTIMPDEPNRGGGGGGGADLGSMYEEMFEEVPLPDWVLNIKDAINQGDWTGAGELLAEKVNSLIDKLKDNAKNWGRNIGQAIQHGIELSLGFIRKVDIEGVGQSITTLIGNALDNINPHDLGAIIASGIKSAFRFAHGLLQGYTGPEIGTYLANVVNGWFAELRSNKGWAKAGDDLNKIILSIINGVSSFIEGLNTDSVEKDLKDFFGKIDWDGIWSSLERLAQIAADKIPWKDMLNSLWRFAANVLVFLRSSVLGIPSNQASQPWKDLEAKLSSASETINWADIISGLIAFVGDIVTTIKNKLPDGGFEEIWESLKNTLSEALGFVSWDDMVDQFKEKVFTVIKDAFDTAVDAVYGWLTGSGSLLGDLAANVFFPDRYQVDKATQNFIGYLKAGSLEAAQAQINAMVSNGTLTASEAARIAAEHGYSYANGLLSSLPDVNGAAETISNTVNSSLGKIDNDVEVVVNANKTPAFDAAVEQIAETNDKAATLSATVNNTNTSSSEEVQNLWSSVDDKTATLIAVVRDASPKARQSVQEAWESVEDKNVTLKATIRDANPKALESIKSAWGEISDKTATLNARVVDAMSSTRTKMLDAWDELKTKTVTLTARASNPNEGTFTTLLSTWTSLQSKTVTVTAKGTINDSVNNAKNALNNISNKSATVTLYGSLTNAFNSAKNAYDSLKSKTVSVTVNGRSSGVGGRATGGVFYGGKWHDVAGYAGGGRPRSAQLFYANENGIPELIGRIGANTAVMNNGQIVSSVASGVYRAVSAAMGGLGNYFANIANGMSRIPDALRDITPVSPQPITLERDMSVYQQMEAGGYNRYGSDGVSVRDQESTENIINAIMAMGRQIISAINENGGDFYLDGQMVGTRTTEVQNRQSRIYGRPVAST